MKKYISIIIILMLPSFAIFAQMVTDATNKMRINSGTTLYSEGDINNNGMLTNTGKIVTQTSIYNQGTLSGNGSYDLNEYWWNSGTFNCGTSKVYINGPAFSGVLSSGSPFYFLYNKKSDNYLYMYDNLLIKKQLNFLSTNNAYVYANEYDLVIQNGATIAGYDANEFVITNSTGSLVKNSLGVTNFIFPIGRDWGVYNPITISNQGTSDNIGVRCLNYNFADGTPLPTNNGVNLGYDIKEETAGASSLTIKPQWSITQQSYDFDKDICGVQGHLGAGAYEASTYAAATGTTTLTRSRANISTLGEFAVVDNGLNGAACTPPDGIQAINQTSTSALIIWNAVPGISNYQLKYRQLGTTTFTTVNVATNQALINGLIPNTDYQYYVRTNCGGNVYSVFTLIKTFKTNDDALACGTPLLGTEISLSSSSEQVFWNVVNGAVSYQLRYRLYGTVTFTTVAATSNLNVIINGLSPNTLYEYQVRTKCSGNVWSAFSAYDYFMTSPTGVAALLENTTEELSDLQTIESEDTPSKDNLDIANQIQLSVFPNPAMDEINLQWNGCKATRIRIFDMKGDLVQDIIPSNESIETIDIFDIPAGMYMIGFETDKDEKIIKKFVKL